MIFLDAPENFSARFEVVSCFCESNDEILLLKRQPHKSEGGKWGVPAGKIEDREDVTKAMQRELEEETGIGLSNNELKFFKKVFVRYPEYDFVYYIFSTLLDQRSEVVLEAKEHTEFLWVKPPNALQLNLVGDLDECVKLFFKI